MFKCVYYVFSLLLFKKRKQTKHDFFRKTQLSKTLQFNGFCTVMKCIMKTLIYSRK